MSSQSELHEFAFDVTLVAAMRVKARSEAEARKMVVQALDCANANLGAWKDGSPILAEVSTDPNGYDISGCYEVDGEATPQYQSGKCVRSARPKG